MRTMSDDQITPTLTTVRVSVHDGDIITARALGRRSALRSLGIAGTLAFAPAIARAQAPNDNDGKDPTADPAQPPQAPDRRPPHMYVSPPPPTSAPPPTVSAPPPPPPPVLSPPPPPPTRAPQRGVADSDSGPNADPPG